MANLKLDLVNKINNDKMFDELELVRLAQEPNMNYRDKVETMDGLLSKIATSNSKLELVEQYFQDAPAQAPQGAPAQANPPQAQVQQGQSHGE